jgi:hypothetical protein
MRCTSALFLGYGELCRSEKSEILTNRSRARSGFVISPLARDDCKSSVLEEQRQSVSSSFDGSGVYKVEREP